MQYSEIPTGVLSQSDLRENYHFTPVAFDPKKGYPSGKAFYYECLECGWLMSLAFADWDHADCPCRNLGCDWDAGRFDVRNTSKVALYELTPKAATSSDPE